MSDAPSEGLAPGDIVHAVRWLTARSPTPVLVTEGPRHLVRYANAAFVELLAASDAPPPTDRPFAEAFPEVPHEAGGALLDVVYATGEPARTPDFARTHPRKGPRVLAFCVWPALDEGGGPRRLVIEVRDGTDQAREIQRGRELAEETRAINERLVVAGVRMQELVDEAESARERLAILAEAGGLLGASIDIAVMVRAVARLLVTHLVDVCAVEILEGPGVEATTVVEPSVISPATERALACARAGIVGGAPLDRVILASDGDDALARELRALGFASSLSIPLRSPTRRLAVLTVLDRRGGRDLADVTTCIEVADRVAMAIERVDHYQKAVSAARAREELLATVSHDLRNPLHTILFSLALVEKSARGRSPNDARHLARIRRTADYMQHLLADLVDSAKIEAHRFLVDRAPCAVAPLVADVVEMMQPLAASKSIHLETAIDADAAGAVVWMDRDRMTQVLTNLLGNAVKFTPERGAIVVRAERRGDEMRFSVHDTGPGIPREDLERVFDRFWQARKTAQLGSGLGLFIAQGIVLAHGGTIWAESDVGAGSTLHVALPASPGPAPDAEGP
jgi:signal transduction histidine kinase